MVLKNWKKVKGRNDVYKNNKGDEIGIIKWNTNEYHILTNTSVGLRKIGISKNKSGAIKKSKSYRRTH